MLGLFISAFNDTNWSPKMMIYFFRVCDSECQIEIACVILGSLSEALD
jgi:hypothetical protein